MNGPPRKRSDFTGLTKAEEKLLGEYMTGETVIIGDGKRPSLEAGAERQIRADLIRYLLLGGCKELDPPIHEKGVQVYGARITGTLDLVGCRSPRNLVLGACHFDQAPNLLSATLALVVFNRSKLPGMIADGLITSEGLFLRSAKVTSAIRLLGANIGGNLSFTGAELTGNAKATGAEAAALRADGKTVKGYVFLSQTKTKGSIRLVGADIGGNLECDGAELTACENGETGKGVALDLDKAKIKGTFFLREGASINGTLDMYSAEIGNLNDDPACWPKPGNLTLNRCRYGAFTGGGVTARERLRWLGLQDPTRFGQEFWPQPWEHCAKVLLEMGHRSDARAILIDKERRQRDWAQRTLKARLDGAGVRQKIEQQARAGKSESVEQSIEAASKRLENWPKGLPGKSEYASQVSSASVFAKPLPDGKALPPIIANAPSPDHVMAARDTIISTQAELYARRLWDGILSVFLGYGYRPAYAISWLIGAWLVGVYIFAVAWGDGAFKPNNPFILRSPEWAYCAPTYTPLPQHEALSQLAPRNPGTQTQLTCFLEQPEALAYPRFNPWTYSADTLLPIVSLEMQQYWIPDETAARSIGQGARLFLWAQIAFGWALSLLAVAGFSGLVRND